MNTVKESTLPPLPEAPPMIEYAASERPATRGDRLAFQLWIIMFLGVIAFTLIQYILNWML